MNSVKRYLRDKLVIDLFEPIEHTYSAKCSCREQTEYGYNKTLYDTRVWPLERVHLKLAMNEILSQISQFSFTPGMNACVSCRQDYTGKVRAAVQSTADYFEGPVPGMSLASCLRFPEGAECPKLTPLTDCMEHSKPKTEHGDDDFWMDHPLPDGNWSRYCRISHDMTTWVRLRYT